MADELSFTPQPFGDYLFLLPLGVGGMGEVFLARHGSVGGIEKYCVVKTVKSTLGVDREYVARFVDEARVVVRLTHRNICQVFDVGQVGDQLYLAMEYVSGCDLRSVLGRLRSTNQRLRADLATYAVGEVLEALDYAHRRVDAETGQSLEIVHRDVSLHNVMVSYEGEVKLIDFGLASSKLKIERTAPNVVVGKLNYMSPEQVRGEPLDRRSDIFSVGVVLCELLTGLRYYEGVRDLDLVDVVARARFEPAGLSFLDDELGRVITRATAFRAVDRYPSGQSFRDDLVNYQLNRRHRAGTRELRELMESLFVEEHERERRLFRTFSTLRSDRYRNRGGAGRTRTVRFATALAGAQVEEVARGDLPVPAASPSSNRRGESLVDVPGALGPEEATVTGEPPRDEPALPALGPIPTSGWGGATARVWRVAGSVVGRRVDGGRLPWIGLYAVTALAVVLAIIAVIAAVKVNRGGGATDVQLASPADPNRVASAVTKEIGSPPDVRMATTDATPRGATAFGDAGAPTAVSRDAGAPNAVSRDAEAPTAVSRDAGGADSATEDGATPEPWIYPDPTVEGDTQAGATAATRHVEKNAVLRERSRGARRLRSKPAREVPVKERNARRTLAERLVTLERHCQHRTSCAGPLVTMGGDRRELKGPELRAFTNEVDHCLARCRRQY